MSERRPRKRNTGCVAGTPADKRTRWECAHPEQLKLGALVARTQLVGLLAMENKVMKQMQLTREGLLDDVTGDLVEVVVEKLTPMVKQTVADTITGEGEEKKAGNSAVIETVIEKIFPEVANLVESTVNAAFCRILDERQSLLDSTHRQRSTNTDGALAVP